MVKYCTLTIHRVCVNNEQLKDRLLSHSTSSQDDFTLHLPTMHQGTQDLELSSGAAEMKACQVSDGERASKLVLLHHFLFMHHCFNSVFSTPQCDYTWCVCVCTQGLVLSFTGVYELACNKMVCLEREISSYQSHITALKAELHNACVRENQCYVSCYYYYYYHHLRCLCLGSRDKNERILILVCR